MLPTCFQTPQKQPFKSHVVTLWYRPPDIFLGSTNYDAFEDLCSAGCILAELFAGKHIMPRRTKGFYAHEVCHWWQEEGLEEEAKVQISYLSSLKLARKHVIEESMHQFHYLPFHSIPSFSLLLSYFCGFIV